MKIINNLNSNNNNNNTEAAAGSASANHHPFNPTSSVVIPQEYIHSDIDILRFLNLIA